MTKSFGLSSAFTFASSMQTIKGIVNATLAGLGVITRLAMLDMESVGGSGPPSLTKTMFVHSVSPAIVWAVAGQWNSRRQWTRSMAPGRGIL